MFLTCEHICPNNLPLWQSVTKHITNMKCSKLQIAQYKDNAHNNKSNLNYYSSVASVDSSSIESTCIFPETLNKTHKCMCDRKTVNQQN